MAWLDGSGVDPSKFLHPYGVSNRTNDDGREEVKLCESSIELLDALLPRQQMEEERARTLLGVQRALLDKQLRLSRKRWGQRAWRRRERRGRQSRRMTERRRGRARRGPSGAGGMDIRGGIGES